MNVLTDIFLFYTRFTTPDGVARLFNKGTSTVPGYSQLQQQALAEAGKETPVKLDNYVFGANIDAVSSRINNLNGFYLFVDYGEIECNVNKTNCQTDSMRLGVTVAYRIKEFSGDLMEQLLVSDSCMDYLSSIRRYMHNDHLCRTWLKNFSGKHTLVPFVARDLSSIGWTMMFNREGVDSFNLKGFY